MSDPLPRAPQRASRLRRRIGPGDFHATGADAVITTVLGSCVCVCLKDPVAGVAGMNHFMLPGPATSPTPPSDKGRYGAAAIEMLLDQLVKLGASRSRVWAKAFGAANVLGKYGVGNRLATSNAEFTIRFLAAQKIPLVASDLGGSVGRKVEFHTRSGDVFVRMIGNLSRRRPGRTARRPSPSAEPIRGSGR